MILKGYDGSILRLKAVTKIVNILIVSMKDFIVSVSVSKDLHCRLCVLNNLIKYCYYSILYHKKTVFKRYNSAT